MSHAQLRIDNRARLVQCRAEAEAANQAANANVRAIAREIADAALSAGEVTFVGDGYANRVAAGARELEQSIHYASRCFVLELAIEIFDAAVAEGGA